MKSIYAYPVLFFLILSAFSSQAMLLNSRFNYSFTNPFCSWCEDSQVDTVQFIPAKTIFLRLLAPADPDFIADLLWLRTTYYFGAHAVTDREYDYLFYLLDRITDLSPDWESAYLFGTIALYLESEDPYQALVLARKGLSHVDSSWRLYFLKGYILWKSFQALEPAANFLFKASQCDGAPFFLAGLSLRLAAKSGNEAFSKMFNEVVLKSLKDPLQKEMIKQKLETGFNSHGHGN